VIGSWDQLRIKIERKKIFEASNEIISNETAYMCNNITPKISWSLKAETAINSTYDYMKQMQIQESIFFLLGQKVIYIQNQLKNTKSRMIKIIRAYPMGGPYLTRITHPLKTFYWRMKKWVSIKQRVTI